MTSVKVTPLNQDTLSKTRCGLVQSFADIFTGVRYAKCLHSDRTRGTAYDYRSGEVYLSTPLGGPLPNSVPEGKVLTCTPSAEFMKPRFSPRIASRGQWQSVPPSCVRLIHWKAQGVYLVRAGDPNMIHDEWWAFVPDTESFVVTMED